MCLVLEMQSLQGIRRAITIPVCANQKEGRNIPFSADQSFLQTATASVMSTAPIFKSLLA